MDYERAVSPEESRRLSLVTGVLWLITFAVSIPALYLYQPVLDDPAGYIAGAGHDNRIFLAAFLELVLIVANIGTAVLPYPLLKRENEGFAIGFVASRIVESTIILIGILAALTIVSLQQNASPANEHTYGHIAYALAAVKDWTFLLGPGFVVGIGNGILFGWLMYRSGLVPPRMALLGLVGGPLICISGVAVLFGVDQPGGPLQGLATIPEFLWELSVGVYFTVYGFRQSPILEGSPSGQSPAIGGTAVAPA